ncbi:Orf y [Tanacetum coccineum]
MNYEPVIVGNQTKKNAGIKDNVDAVPTQQYILLPLLYDGPQSSKDAVVDDAGKKTNEEPANEGKRNGLEKEGGASNKQDDQNVQDFRVALDNLLVQQKKGYANSLNTSLGPMVGRRNLSHVLVGTFTQNKKLALGHSFLLLWDGSVISAEIRTRTTSCIVLNERKPMRETKGKLDQCGKDPYEVPDALGKGSIQAADWMGDELPRTWKNICILRNADPLGKCSLEIAELEVSEEEFLEINESIYFNQEGSRAFQEQFKPIIDRLKQQGYIGEEPLKHWKKNAMEDIFRKHVDSLLKIGAIRPSKSRHRTMAMIVNSGTTVDPVTGREVKGKERMVFNYKSLNDNTYKDQYSLPGINTIIKRIGGAKIFSKFDLKSGFHQVAMDEESIPWTAFLVPGGLYEWLVMPFGLKNAPAVFQRKMDKCFKGTESFIAVYIDDILVFSKNEKDHAKHLEKMLKICEDNGLVLSPTKMKIAVSTVDFLGAVIGEGTIKLQPHIIKKIVNFNEEELKTKKGLRSFLGILNYARNHIPKLGILLRPLYEKTNAHGDKRLKPSDYELVRKIKEQVQNLPDLEIPPENAYIILETDGCMEGWGGIVKWKKSKEDPRSSERICAYASGKFSTTQSTIDAEINACINTLEKLKIYYLDKQEVTLRTDCQAIISFYNKTNSNKSSRVRWIKFADAVTGTGVKINIEHIEGKHNTLADSLSRLVNLCFAGCTGEMKELSLMSLLNKRIILVPDGLVLVIYELILSSVNTGWSCVVSSGHLVLAGFIMFMLIVGLGFMVPAGLLMVSSACLVRYCFVIAAGL